jgi:hypothetical protein
LCRYKHLQSGYAAATTYTVILSFLVRIYFLSRVRTCVAAYSFRCIVLANTRNSIDGHKTVVVAIWYQEENSALLVFLQLYTKSRYSVSYIVRYACVCFNQRCSLFLSPEHLHVASASNYRALIKNLIRLLHELKSCLYNKSFLYNIFVWFCLCCVSPAPFTHLGSSLILIFEISWGGL